MSAGSKHEIVIIRRGGHGDHDDHHGGVWKIAFADFMTAMMAFFLVMWLISANDKTRASVARYFNPVKLVDTTTQPRGLHDSKKDDSGITASQGAKEAGDKSKEAKETPAKAEGPKANETASGKEKRLDAALRTDPLAALAEIAADRGANDKDDASHPGTLSIGRKGGAAFRDPFAPPPRQIGLEVPDEELGEAKLKTVSKSQKDDSKDAVGVQASPDAKQPKLPDLKPSEAKTEELAQQLKVAVNEPGRAGAGPGVDVRATREGLLVRLTDTGSFSMFANGSAVPSRRVVLMMESVAKILAKRSGVVVIRGFTDNKQFRSNRYDNWHLSLDRAQTAHYMLVRGGLPDARVASVEGLADHAAKAGIDPGSPLNRRIEILLKDDAQ